MEIYEIIALCMLAAAMIIFVVKMMRDESKTVQSWLLYATIRAEYHLGSGKGQQKLMAVYNMFMERFPVVSVFVSFETFSRWVDIALDGMKVIFSMENTENEPVPPAEEEYDED